MANSQKYECLICRRDLISEDRTLFEDHFCNQEDHHFVQRIQGHQLTKLRVRFSEANERLVLKIHYDEGYSEVWSKPSLTDEDHIRINQIIVPDFENIEVLKNKIRTILLFS